MLYNLIVMKDEPIQLFSVESVYENLAREVQLALDRQPHLADDVGGFTVVIAKTAGYAMKYILDNFKDSYVVITDNPCPEYWDDLWDLHPQVLLAGGHSVQELAIALNRAAKGEVFRKTPLYETPLTDREREALKLCARGFHNHDIADTMGVTRRTVKNHLSCVYEKLALDGREKATLYYWGMWHWFDNHPIITSLRKHITHLQ